MNMPANSKCELKCVVDICEVYSSGTEKKEKKNAVTYVCV